jgi:hypothetical protein
MYITYLEIWKAQNEEGISLTHLQFFLSLFKASTKIFKICGEPSSPNSLDGLS